MSNVFPTPTEPGYYWAKQQDDMSDYEFEPVQVIYTDKWNQKFKVVGYDFANYDLDYLEWGPKIEMPKELTDAN